MTHIEIQNLKKTHASVSRDADEYFAQFDKLLPSGLPEGTKILLWKIDNAACIMKIVNKSPRASYTVFGDSNVSKAIKAIAEGIDVSIADTTKMPDCSGFDYICYNWPPDSRSPVDLLKIGLKAGDKLSLTSKDGKTDYAVGEVFDGRKIKMPDGSLFSLFDFFYETVVKVESKNVALKNLHSGAKWLKHSREFSGHYTGYIMVKGTGLSVKDLHKRYLESRCVVKN